jgi:hypothetical protein
MFEREKEKSPNPRTKWKLTIVHKDRWIRL